MNKIITQMILGGSMLLSPFAEDVHSQSKQHTSSLNAKQQNIITISAFTANGNQEQLNQSLNEGLNGGSTINEIKEILVQLYAYAGFPRSLNAINTFETVVNERRQKGIKDDLGKESGKQVFENGRYEFGKNVVTELTGTTATGSAQKFVPVIDTFLKEHLFADIFSRDILDYQSREIATISALASLGGTEAQLKAHLKVGKNVGLTEQQLRSIAFTISTKVGWQEGNTATKMIDEIFNSKDNSITKTQNGISVQKVTFSNKNITVVGNLYFPKNFDASKEYAAIVVGHPNGGVKEQTAGLYAEKLAEKGYITLAFDASYQGESGGEPRFLDDPEARTEDFRAAADYIATREFVNAEKVGLLGICAGGGYAIHAAQTEHHYKAIATVSMVDGGDLRRNGINGYLTSTIQKRLDEVTRQRIIEANGGPARYNNYVANSKEEILPNASAMYIEGYEYYRVTHKQPTAPNKYTFTSLDKLINFTALDHVELISPRPLLLIAGNKADSYYYSQQAYDRAKEPKELFTVDGATHIQLYWKPEFVEPIVNKLNDFFGKNL